MFKVGDIITGHDCGTDKLVKGNIVRVDTSDVYVPYKILTKEGEYYWVKYFGAKRIPSDFILKDVYLDVLRFEFKPKRNVIAVYKRNVSSKLTELKLEHLTYLKDMIEIYQERHANNQFCNKRIVERYKGVRFNFDLVKIPCPKLHFEIEHSFFAFKLDNKYLLNEELDNFYNWLEETIDILNENIQHEPSQPVNNVINDVMEDYEIEKPITGEHIQSDILEATKVFITLLATTPYKDLVKLTKHKPKYIISVGSPDYNKNYITHVTPEDNHGLLGKYQTTQDKEKAIVFGNKENAENFIKNHLNPNRKFEVITK